MEVNWTNIWLAVIAAVSAGFGAWLSYLSHTIHKAVNSERTAMQAELQRLNELVAMQTELKRLKELVVTLELHITRLEETHVGGNDIRDAG